MSHSRAYLRWEGIPYLPIKEGVGCELPECGGEADILFSCLMSVWAADPWLCPQPV